MKTLSIFEKSTRAKSGRSLSGILFILILGGISSGAPSRVEAASSEKVIEKAKEGEETFQFSPPQTFSNGRQPGQIDRVTCRLEAGGEITHLSGKKEHRDKMSIDCNLGYHEKTLTVASDPKGTSRSVRYYDQAEGTVKIGEKGFNASLREDRRLLVAEVSESAVPIFSPKGLLTREELDLVVVLGNSLVLDRFLPDKEVSPGDRWEHSEKLMAQFLGLDEVGQCDVQSTLKEVTSTVARFELSGKVSGVVDGVTTDIELKARYRYDRRRNRIDWLGLLVKEKRQASPVTDGFDVVAKLQVIVTPGESVSSLSDSALKGLPLESSPERLELEHYSKKGGWAIGYGRSWNLTDESQDKAVLRLLDGGEYLAQANLAILSKGDPKKPISLEDYQEELQTALGKSFGEFVEASESTTSENTRLLRVSIRGKTDDLPMRWNYYHLTDLEGRQASLVFVVEEKLIDRLGGADKKLVLGFHFVP